MQIEIIPETRLSSADDAQVAALLNRAFGTEFGGRSYFMQRHHIRVVARAPHIVGHIALTFRSVRSLKGLISIIGVADVATDPDRRGEGIASTLLKTAIEEAHRTPADFILLFGDAALYSAAGFQAAQNTLISVDLTEARTGAVQTMKHEGLMVLPLKDVDWDNTAPIDMLGHLF